jgi:hypothetical protein
MDPSGDEPVGSVRTAPVNSTVAAELRAVAAAGIEAAEAGVQRVTTLTSHGASSAKDALVAYMALTAEAVVAYAAMSAGRAQAGARAKLKSARRALFPPKQYPMGSRGARRQVGRAMYLKMSEEQRQEYRLEMAAHRLLEETAYLGFQSKPDLAATDASLPLSTRVAMARRVVRAKEAALEEEEEAAAFSSQLAQLADPWAMRDQRLDEVEQRQEPKDKRQVDEADGERDVWGIAWPGEKSTRADGNASLACELAADERWREEGGHLVKDLTSSGR